MSTTFGTKHGGGSLRSLKTFCSSSPKQLSQKRWCRLRSDRVMKGFFQAYFLGYLLYKKQQATGLELVPSNRYARGGGNSTQSKLFITPIGHFSLRFIEHLLAKIQYKASFIVKTSSFQGQDIFATENSIWGHQKWIFQLEGGFTPSNLVHVCWKTYCFHRNPLEILLFS